MADLYLDFAGLTRTSQSLTHIKELLSSPLDTMNDRAGAATDIDELRSKLRDFGDEWDYGIKKLSEYTDGLGEALDEIRAAFEELEDELASTFDEFLDGTP